MSYGENDNQPKTSVFERVPEAVVPKQRSGALVRVLGNFLGWTVGLVMLLIGFAMWAYSAFSSPGPLTAPKTVMIQPGLDRPAIIETLKREGVISNSTILNTAFGLLSFRGVKIKPGEYEFSAGQSMEDVFSILRLGRTLTYKLTIPEGWTTQMALNRISDNQVLDGALPATPAEGALMADTYVFQRGMTREQLVADMTTAQTKLLDALWPLRATDSPVRTKEELVTLASIVEKETGKADERPLVAAVFLNRLKKGMRLQSDPTIIYGIVGGKGKLERPLLRTDIETETPYNTYRINGLPPGPIANPGRAAMEAVLKPAPVEYLYFVADGTGGHAFATTLEEHNANVAKWRQVETTGGTPIAVKPGTIVDPGNVATGMEQLNLDQPVDPAPADGQKDAKAAEPAKKPASKAEKKKPAKKAAKPKEAKTN